jgi:DNA-binding transcriptional MocR family regulator
MKLCALLPALARSGLAGIDIFRLDDDVSSREVVERGQRRDLDLWSLDRYVIQRRDLRGLLLGFAAFTEREIREAVVALASVIDDASSARARTERLTGPA